MRKLNFNNRTPFSQYLREFLLYLCLFCLLLSNDHIAQTSTSRMVAVETSIGPQVIFPDGSVFSSGNMEQKMKDFNINGISVAVVNDGQIDWSKGYGILKAGGSEEVTTLSLFQCASIGKMISSLAALKLVEEGLISLDENVNNKLKQWKIKENDLTRQESVTLRHLLSHSSGLTDEYGFPGYSPGSDIPNVIQILNGESPSNTKKSFEINTIPGQTERYSGAGYLIIQILIEDLSGKSFVDYVQEKILLPFEMGNTTYDDQPDINMGKTIASGHRSNGKVLKKKDYHIYPEKAAAGPWTTAEDLARLIIGIQTKETPLIKEMLTPQINNKGLGVNLKGVYKPEAFWHAGQNEGYTGLLYGLNNEGHGAIILTNSIGGEQFIQEFISSVAKVYDWPVMNSYKAMKIDNKTISSISGNYVNAETEKSILIEADKGRLFVKANGGKKRVELYQIAENRFTFQKAQDYYEIGFTKENNVITEMLYTESIGKTIQLIKTD